jgi:hypothetical protein
MRKEQQADKYSKPGVGKPGWLLWKVDYRLYLKRVSYELVKIVLGRIEYTYAAWRLLNVPLAIARSWEQGKSKLSGAALRFLDLVHRQPQLLLGA